MEADDLASADDLWWSWAVLADGDRLPEGATTELDTDEHVLHYHLGESWTSMQRIGGGRAVLWGRVADAARDAISERVDPLAGAPDWARSDAVWHSIRVTRPGFLAWYSRDGWDTSTTGMFDGVVELLAPLLRADPRLVADARAGNTGSLLLKEAHGVAHVAAQGSIRNRLKTQIHRQMRDTPDRDRGLPERPTLLARWVRITEPPSFEHVVCVDEGELVTVEANPQLSEATLTSLTNVLHELHRAEAGEESGAWLVARVRYDGHRIILDRGFDGLPPWFPGTGGPTLRALTWEMQQRSSRWRPAWARLLPE